MNEKKKQKKLCEIKIRNSYTIFFYIYIHFNLIFVFFFGFIFVFFYIHTFYIVIKKTNNKLKKKTN